MVVLHLFTVFEGVNLRHQPVDRKQAAREYNSYSVVTQFRTWNTFALPSQLT